MKGWWSASQRSSSSLNSNDYEFAFALRLEDMSGALVAWCVGKEAATFLSAEPANLRSNVAAAKCVRERVRAITTPGVWFECCLLRRDFTPPRPSLFYIFGTSPDDLD